MTAYRTDRQIPVPTGGHFPFRLDGRTKGRPPRRVGRVHGGIKTVRFSRVVEKSGAPHVHTLWVEPQHDPEFQRAVAANRVMTIAVPRGNGTRAGTVGFEPQTAKGSEFLVFPRTLEPFEGKRVVGIKFDLIENPEVKPAERYVPAPPKPRKSPRSGRSTPAPPRAENVVAFEPESKPPHALVRHAARHANPATARSPKPKVPLPAAAGRAIRGAMKELKRGDSAAAYRRLEQFIDQAEA